MAKICAVCGKKPGFGNSRSHSMVATKRRFNPNLQRVRVLLDGKATRAYVCTRCLKSGKVEKAMGLRAVKQNCVNEKKNSPR
jgi:large subunit ribosomal protein L28